MAFPKNEIDIIVGVFNAWHYEWESGSNGGRCFDVSFVWKENKRFEFYVPTVQNSNDLMLQLVP